MRVIRIPVTHKTVKAEELDTTKQKAAQSIQSKLADIISAKPGRREQLWKKDGPSLIRTLRNVLGESQKSYSQRFNLHERTLGYMENGQYLHNLPVHDFAKKFSEIKRSEIDQDVPANDKRVLAAQKAAETRRMNAAVPACEPDQDVDEYIKEQASDMVRRMTPEVKKPITVHVRGIDISGEVVDVAEFLREVGVFDK